MKRILVAGVSAGAGKSTFARKLGEKSGIPVHHLDSYYWKAGWIESEQGEFRAVQKELVEEESWIIEGNYTGTFDIRLPKADTFIYLEVPLAVCIYRVLKRWLTNMGRTRPDMAEGCPEKMDLAFLKFIITTYSARRVKMRRHMSDFLRAHPDHRVIFLDNQKKMDNFLRDLK